VLPPGAANRKVEFDLNFDGKQKAGLLPEIVDLFCFKSVFIESKANEVHQSMHF
jgi:hypothetical protein